MYRTVLGVSFIYLQALSIGAEVTTDQILSENNEPAPVNENDKPINEIDDFDLNELNEYDDPLIAEYLSQRLPRLGDKIKRTKRNMPFANDDEVGNFFRYMPDEDIAKHLMNEPFMDENDGPDESLEMASDENSEQIDHEMSEGNLEDDFGLGLHPGMRRLHQYYGDDILDDDYDVDEEKLFANQFPSREEVAAKSRHEMDELYQKIKHQHHHHRRP